VAATQHDLGADVLGMPLQALAEQRHRALELALLPIGVGQGREQAPPRVLGVAALELLDLAGVRHPGGRS
jgi:hypothetical protein